MFYTTTTHQIWSCHVTLAGDLENFYFLPNSVLNFGKIYQIWGKVAQEQKSYRQKQFGGGTPPLLIGLNGADSLNNQFTLRAERPESYPIQNVSLLESERSRS